MSHQLPHRHGPLFCRKRGYVRLNRIIELEAAFFQQQTDRGGRERHGGRSDPEPRLWRDRHMILEIRPAKTFGPHEVATGTDRHR
jgi:hypothetical protein